MDDHRFDDIIKNKIGDYEDPQFDPAALSSFHNQMAAIGISPWYVRFRNELLLAAGLITLTIILLWYQSTYWKQHAGELDREIEHLKNSQTDEIAQLQKELKDLKALPPDTVRIIEIRQIPVNIYSLPDHLNMEDMAYAYRTGSSGESPVYLGKEEELPADLFEILKSEGFVKQDGESVYLVAAGKDRVIYIDKIGPASLVDTANSISIVIDYETNDISDLKESTPVSVKTLRELEKHYTQGVGIKVGPTVELSTGIYPGAKGHLDTSVGFLADLIMSPSISIETGLKQHRKRYEATDPATLKDLMLPGLDPTLGTLESSDVESWIIDIPVNLKYRYPLSLKTYWKVGVGYSLLIYRKQDFEYSYSYTQPTQNETTIISSKDVSRMHVYPGTLNLSLGMAHELKNKKIVEASIYYQQSFSNLGYEQIGPSFLGLKGVYWFTVR